MRFGLPERDLELAVSLVGEDTWRHMSGARVFVTGGTGFVGKWLLATLAHADDAYGLECEAVALSRNTAKFAEEEPALAGARCLTLLQGDVRRFEAPPGEFTHVVHGAADVVTTPAPLETIDVALTGTRAVMELAVTRGARDVLLLSSGAVYGRQPRELDRLEEGFCGAPDVTVPTSAYGEGKRLAELITHAMSAEGGIRRRVARCFAFVGPHLALDKHFAIGNFIDAAMDGRPIVVGGDGTPLRTYLYAADLAGWLWAMLLRGHDGLVCNVGGDEPLSIASLAHRVNRVLASSAGVEVRGRPAPDALPERYVPSVERVRSTLDLPAPLPLDEAIERTAMWHRTQKGTTHF